MNPAAAWLMAGSLWAGCLVSGRWWLGLAGVALLVTAARRPRLPVVLAGLVLVGAGLAGGRGALLDEGRLAAQTRDVRPVSIEAVVVTEPRETLRGAWFIVRVERLDGAPVRERALVRAASLDEAPELGERLALVATVRPLDDDGLDRHARRLHAAAGLTVFEQSTLTPAGPLLRATTTVRVRARATFDAVYPDDRGPLLAGLVLGDSTGRSPQRSEQFASAGLSHLVVVSGKHVAVMLAGVLALGAVCGFGARGRRWVCLVALAWFVLLVRWQPSVLRAGVMAGLVLGAGLLGRGHDARHALAMAVLLLLLADPFLAGQAGFALSVLATFGVLVAAPRIGQRLRGPKAIRVPVAVTVGAQLGAAPVLLGLQPGIGVGSVPANVVAVPAAAYAQTLGLVTAALAQVWPAAAELAAAAAGPGLTVVLWAADMFAHSPELRPAHLMSPVALLGVGALVLRGRRPGAALLCGVIAAGLALAPWLRPPAGVDTLTVTLLDVGQGDALLVEVPGVPPARLLWDGGPDPRVVSALLRERGIRRLDVVAVSHPHHDHVAGLPAVLRRLDVGALLVAPPPHPEAGEPARGAGEAVEIARRRGIPVIEVSAGRSLRLGGALLEVLSPPADGSLAHDLNEQSLVVRVRSLHGSILLTGDAEQGAQQRLLRHPGRLRADVLQVPHHGGNTSLPAFFTAVGADVALIGVGADNSYGHPHPAVLEALAGARVHRTDLHGTVRVPVGCAVGHPGCDGASTRLPLRRLGGAAPAPRRGPAAGRAPSRGRRARRDRPPCRGGARARSARPAHRLAVRHPQGARRPRGPGAAGGGSRRPARRAREPCG